MGEIRFVGTGETRGYPYLVCKKRIVGPGKTRGYPYPVCKKSIYKLRIGNKWRNKIRTRYIGPICFDKSVVFLKIAMIFQIK